MGIRPPAFRSAEKLGQTQRASPSPAGTGGPQAVSLAVCSGSSPAVGWPPLPRWAGSGPGGLGGHLGVGSSPGGLRSGPAASARPGAIPGRRAHPPPPSVSQTASPGLRSISAWRSGPRVAGPLPSGPWGRGFLRRLRSVTGLPRLRLLPEPHAPALQPPAVFEGFAAGPGPALRLSWAARRPQRGPRPAQAGAARPTSGRIRSPVRRAQGAPGRPAAPGFPSLGLGSASGAGPQPVRTYPQGAP